MANQNKLTSFSHVLYPCHWLIMGGFPAKIDQSLVFPLCLIDELEQSDLEKERNDSHSTFNRNAKHCKEREKALKKESSLVSI